MNKDPIAFVAKVFVSFDITVSGWGDDRESAMYEIVKDTKEYVQTRIPNIKGLPNAVVIELKQQYPMQPEYHAEPTYKGERKF